MDVTGTSATLLDSGSGSGSFSTNNSNTSMFRCSLPPYFPPSLNIHPAISYVQVVIALIMGFTGFFLGLFVLFVIIKYKRLHQRLMYLAAQIIAVDLLYTFTIPPVIFTSGVAGTWLLGTAPCNILGMIHDGYVMFRFLMTLILTLDRFVSVFWPFFYMRRSKHFICVLTTMVYFIAIVRIIIPMYGILDCYLYIHTLKTCTVFSGCSDSCFWLVVTHSIIVLSFGMLLPLLLYIILFCKSKSMSRNMKKRMSITHSLVSKSVAFSTSVPLGKNLNSLSNKRISPLQQEIVLMSFSPGEMQNSACGYDFNSTASEGTQSHSIEPELSTTTTNGGTRSRLPSIVSSASTWTAKSRNRNLRTNITMFILLMSVIGSTTPAFTLYFIQFSTLRTSPVLFIINMLVGRTFFNLIPVIDSIAIMRHREFRLSVKDLAKSIRKLCCNCARNDK